MVRKLAIGLVLVLGGLALFVATRPAAFHIERATTVAAPPEAVYALVNDFRAWPRWSPYEQKDPAMRRTLGGPEAGVGATYAWDGNDDVGAGGMTITESVPGRRVAIRLEFSRPMTATNDVAFSFDDAGGATRVVWSMDGRNGFLGKLASLLLDMDAMVGADFEAGLAALKSAAEADARRPAGPVGSG
jgi:uncharacterized protein YndB with AHSA1/START domain